MLAAYLDSLQVVERLHRQLLEVIKSELDQRGIRDVNNVQALILFNIGDEEVTVGELTLRGYYLGSNVSYNVKKLVENGYLIQERSLHDRRSFNVRASDDGRNICKMLADFFARHAGDMGESGLVESELEESTKTLERLLRFLSAPQRLSRLSPAA
ncbi:MarR family winged helix-turn-helix transcriptional regulator [Algihabitans sp.]|uniref:MarR family winged helix-turn-helix transcriptional regulator n=1 Tax=Algihabitans sp. TaxID=2821514 RepID=UPI003BA9631D